MSDQTPPGDPGDPVGSAAEEAVRLLGALGASLGSSVGEWAHDLGHSVDEHLATGAPECRYCPVCRTVHVLREASPEVRAHLAAAASSLMQAAASVLAAAATPPGSGRSATVERIDLDDQAWEDGE